MSSPPRTARARRHLSTTTKIVEAWNATNPVGCRVKVQRDGAEPPTRTRTRTRSEAWLLGDGTPVVSVEGITGGYLLERVTPMKRDGLNQDIVDEQSYYVADSRTTVGNCISWWRANGAGYACDIDDAGTYLGREVFSMRDTDVPWPVAVVLQSTKRFVDWQVLRSRCEQLQASARWKCARCGGTHALGIPARHLPELDVWLCAACDLPEHVATLRAVIDLAGTTGAPA